MQINIYFEYRDVVKWFVFKIQGKHKIHDWLIQSLPAMSKPLNFANVVISGHSDTPGDDWSADDNVARDGVLSVSVIMAGCEEQQTQVNTCQYYPTPLVSQL